MTPLPLALSLTMSVLLQATGPAIQVEGPMPPEVRSWLDEAAGPILAGVEASLELPLPDPMPVRYYPSSDALLADQPMALAVGGLVDPGPRAHREILLVGEVVGESAGESADGSTGASAGDRVDPAILRARLREGAVTVGASALSRDQASAGWITGFAVWSAGTTQDTAVGVAQLRAAHARDGLRPLTGLMAPGGLLVNPELSRAQAHSVIAYLAEVHTVEAVTTLLAEIGAGRGWQAALEIAVGVEANVLEARWLNWLPRYLDGGWRDHYLYPEDVEAIESLMAAGRLEAAAIRARAAAGFVGLDQPGLGQQLLTAAERAENSVAAHDHLTEAVGLLADGNYAAAQSAARAAADGFESVGDPGARGVADELIRRADLGLAAEGDLAAARAAHRWMAPWARGQSVRAAQAYEALGNAAAAREARRLAAGYNALVQPLGWAVLLSGLVLAGWNLRARRSATVGDATKAP